VSSEDRNPQGLFADPDELAAFAQAYYSTEFPNSKRAGCPTLEALRKAARSGSPPGPDLRLHLFTCSECFRSFRSARIGHVADAVSQPRRLTVGWLLASFRPRFAAVAVSVMCLALLGVGAALMWRTGSEPLTVAKHETPQGLPPPAFEPADRTSQALSAPQTTIDAQPRAPARPSAAATSPARDRKRGRTQQASAPVPVVEINLQDDGLQRGAGQADTKQKTIRLSPAKQRLRLRMPQGSPRGRYTVGLVDAYGKTLVSTSAESDGRILSVGLDLRGLTEKKYRLCVSRGEEAPDCYLVLVSN
jgi:hypothetical protein